MNDFLLLASIGVFGFIAYLVGRMDGWKSGFEIGNEIAVKVAERYEEVLEEETRRHCAHQKELVAACHKKVDEIIAVKIENVQCVPQKEVTDFKCQKIMK